MLNVKWTKSISKLKVVFKFTTVRLKSLPIWLSSSKSQRTPFKEIDNNHSKRIKSAFTQDKLWSFRKVQAHNELSNERKSNGQPLKCWSWDRTDEKHTNLQQSTLDELSCERKSNKARIDSAVDVEPTLDVTIGTMYPLSLYLHHHYQSNATIHILLVECSWIGWIEDIRHVWNPQWSIWMCDFRGIWA